MLAQVLVALACDLSLDTLPCCAEAHKWAWFRRYCSAARVAAAIVTRSALPPVFAEEVGKKIQDIASEGELGSSEHLDHEFFRLEQDEQLLQWLNRSEIDAWVLLFFVAGLVLLFFAGLIHNTIFLQHMQHTHTHTHTHTLNSIH